MRKIGNDNSLTENKDSLKEVARGLRIDVLMFRNRNNSS